VTGVAGAWGFSMALTDTGSVWIWGEHGLSVGANLPAWTPVELPGISDAVAVAAGWAHGLILLGDGTVLSFGANETGQLGIGTGAWSERAVDLGFGTTARALGDSLRVVKSAAPGVVSLSWRLSAPAATYNARRDSDPMFLSSAILGTTAAVSFADAPPAGALWSYRITATDCAGAEGP
jgi:hypothetical protein